MALKLGEEQQVQMPMKTVASLIAIVAIGVWGYFGVIEQINKHDTRLELMEKDLEENFTMLRGCKLPTKTTKGWELCICWKDGTTTWEKLSDLKESNPVELA